ncbi:hypothetical protein KVR01_007252 [Diaporthe batatas]|uniref:uncharacterized protein n=1 Tax=Diaporthe batatas TaxID=748121 RepID=UPI001D043330|nr:uncharacterized protein KVR01_007252 [Diaporthe batatas]KAG8162774.1 hypothetical protein KVR01_007252 [Diaporthe batatas]
MSSMESAENAIRDLGFYHEEDATVGAKISTMLQQRLNPLSKEGLEFYEANVLNDSRIRPILDSFFLPSFYVMARYANFSNDAGHRFLYLRGASNGLFEVPFAALERAGCGEGTPINFDQGGITIQDASIAFEIVEGAFNATIFATEDLASKWPQMVLPDTPDVRKKVDEIMGAELGLHARFETKQAPTG